MRIRADIRAGVADEVFYSLYGGSCPSHGAESHETADSGYVRLLDGGLDWELVDSPEDASTFTEGEAARFVARWRPELSQSGDVESHVFSDEGDYLYTSSRYLWGSADFEVE